MGGGTYPHTKITDSTTEGSTYTTTEKTKFVCTGTQSQYFKIDNENAVQCTYIQTGASNGSSYDMNMGMAILQSAFYGYDFQYQGGEAVLKTDQYYNSKFPKPRFTITVPSGCTIDFAGTWEAYTV